MILVTLAVISKSGYSTYIFTTGKRSWGKVMFSQACVSHSVQSGEGGSLYNVTFCLAAWSHVPSGGLCLWSNVPSRGRSLSRDLCPDQCELTGKVSKENQI